MLLLSAEVGSQGLLAIRHLRRCAVAATLILSVCRVAPGQSYFAPPITLSLPSSPHGLLDPPFVTEIDGDGLPDVVKAYWAPGQFAYFRGADLVAGAALPIVVTLGSIMADSVGWVLGDPDLDGDGDRDLIFLGVGVRNVLNLGNGMFTALPAAVGTQYGSSYSYALADFDNDGMPELVGAPNSSFVPFASIVFWRLSGGQWLSSQVVPVPALFNRLTVGDFNGDGWVDVGLGPPPQQGWAGRFYALANMGGNLSFSLRGPIAAPDSLPPGISAGDVNGDGFDDVVGMDYMYNACVFYGDPLQYLKPVSYEGSMLNPLVITPGYPWQPLVEDIDLDGVADVNFLEADIIAPYPQHTIFSHTFLGRADGLSSRMISDLDIRGAVGMGDLDRDGDSDMVAVGCPQWTCSSYVLRIHSNVAIVGPGAYGSAGAPALHATTATPGNSAFVLALTDAVANMPAVLGVSLDWISPGAAGAGIWLDLSPGNLLLPSGGAGVHTTDHLGRAQALIPIPDRPSLLGSTFYAQWAVVDPGGTFAVGNGINLALSRARKIIIW